MLLEDVADIQAPPESIFGFFQQMENLYLDWHPDHVTFKWVHGHGLAEGNTFYFEEYIAGKLLKKHVRLTKIVPNEYIEFAPTNRLIRLVLPEMSFRIEPIGEQCRLRARIRVRVGPIGAWLNRREFDAVRQHMQQEGANLKAIIEQTARPSASVV